MRLPVAGLSFAAVLLLAGAQVADTSSDVAPEWSMPGGRKSPPPGGWDAVAAIRLRGSNASFTEAQLRNLGRAVDWWPERHPPMPAAVAAGRKPGIFACGFCHMPSGEGGPENATLAGLPSDYIVRQVAAFANGSRHGVDPGYAPPALMAKIAADALPDEIAAAADYFGSIHFVPHVRVVETVTIPRPRALGYVWVSDPGAPVEPLGSRIVESPESIERFERRDSHDIFTAFVPVGSIARGATLAASANCSTCHGAKLTGGIGPPIAGRSPSYIFRQLYAFRAGARTTPEAEPMVAVVAALSTDDMIALAAYTTSRLQPPR